MTNFFNTRMNPTHAFAMLLIWVFGIISGVANACLLEAPGASTHAVTASQPATQHAHQNEKHTSLLGPLQIEVSSAQADDTHTSTQPCLKVCDDSSRSLLKKYPVGQVDPGPPTIVAVLWSLAEPVLLQYKQLDGIQHAPLLPLRIRYARLAL